MCTPGAVLAIDSKVAHVAGVLEQLRGRTVQDEGSILELRDRSPHDLVLVAQILRHRSFARALDLGCGGGRLSPLLTACAARTVLLDINPTVLDCALTLAGDSATAVCAPFEAVPFASATFDLVASRLALHESISHESALKEIKRILMREGTLLVVDVIPPAEREAAKLFDALEIALNPAYARPPSPSQWKAILQKQGFEIEISAATRVRRELVDRPSGEDKRESCIKLIHQFSNQARAALGVCQSGRRLEWVDRRLVVVAKAMR